MKNVRWVLVVLGGFLGEVATLALIMALRLMHGYSVRAYDAPLSTVGRATFLVGVFAVLLLFGWWVARKAPVKPVAHGLLVGIVAVLVYELLTIRIPVPVTWSYVTVHALKLLGGLAGGWIAARRRQVLSTPTRTEVT
jgi:hypothetical protein